MKIAVVEDESSIRNGLAKIIKKLDPEYELVGTAGNGLEGLHLVQNTEPDLVIMDIQMPVMNGFDTTLTIRKMKDDKKAMIPIIAMTANAFAEDRQKALSVGMNDHVAKPVDMNILAPTMMKYL